MTTQLSPETKKPGAGGLNRPPADPPDDEVAPEPLPLRSKFHPRKWIDIQEREARKQYEERNRTIMSRPFGLPKHITLEKYLSTPVCMLSAYNYEVEASIGTNPSDWTSFLSVADTGAGPNLIRADCVPPEVHAKVNRHRHVVNLASASKQKLHTIDTVNLHVNLGGYKCRQPFVVGLRLAADVILGCTFLEEHFESLCRRTMMLTDGTTIPIRRRPAGTPTVFRTREKLEVESALPRENTIRVSRRIVLSPQSETKESTRRE